MWHLRTIQGLRLNGKLSEIYRGRGAVVTITDITQHVVLILPKKTKEEERKTMEKYGKAKVKLR